MLSNNDLKDLITSTSEDTSRLLIKLNGRVNILVGEGETMGDFLCPAMRSLIGKHNAKASSKLSSKRPAPSTTGSCYAVKCFNTEGDWDRVFELILTDGLRVNHDRAMVF